MKYSKSLDHALLATYFANKAAKAKSLTAKRAFEKKAFASILEAGKQSDATYGMKVLEASLRLAAENEGMAPAEEAPVDDLPVDEEMPIEAEAEEDVPAEEEEDDMEIEEDEEEKESDDEEIDAAFRRVMARSRQRKLAARAAERRRARR